MQREGGLDRVEITEADIASLPFHDKTFDLVVCLHGAFRTIQAAKELTMVTKRGGKIIVDALSRYWAAAHELDRNPERALKLLKSQVKHAYDSHGDWMRVFSPEEFKGLFEENGIRIIGMHGSFYQLLPKEDLQRQEWDNRFLTQVGEIMMYLRDEPSVVGMAGILLLVGERI
ncbi:MAG: methyltransferase domain-containing protein [Candidatus Methanospirareceae archaeon]